MRDLVRARRHAKGDLVAARQMLLGFLLRHGRKFPGRTNWTRMHCRWLGEQAFGSPHQQFVFGECIRRIEEAQARCERLDQMLQEAMEGWSLAPLVRALQALRGVGLVISATLFTEIGDLARFQHPRILWAGLGLYHRRRRADRERGAGQLQKPETEKRAPCWSRPHGPIACRHARNNGTGCGSNIFRKAGSAALIAFSTVPLQWPQVMLGMPNSYICGLLSMLLPQCGASNDGRVKCPIGVSVGVFASIP